MERGDEDEYSMDCQYQYLSVDTSDHYGFLSYNADQCIDPLFKERMKKHCRLQIEIPPLAGLKFEI